MSKRSGQYDLWLKDLQSSALKQITNTQESESRGFWSHRSDKIIFFMVSENQDSSIVRIFDLNTNTTKEVLNFPFRTKDILSKMVWKRDDSAVCFLPPYSNAIYEISLNAEKRKVIFSGRQYGIKLISSCFTFGREDGYIVTGEPAKDIYIAEGL